MNFNNNYQRKDSIIYNKMINNKLLIIFILIIFVFLNATVKIYQKKINHFENSIDEIMKDISKIKKEFLTENIYTKNIKHLEYPIDNILNNLIKTEKELNYKSLILNQQFEAILYYLYNIKNSSSIYQLLKPKSILGKTKVRIGKNEDGGYILLNDLENIKIAYSFGISNEISFDKYLADKNIDIFMYDHTIKKLPFNNKRFHWKKIGLTNKIGKQNNMKTLPELIKENRHTNEKNMILKLDIEGEEWNVFNEISTGILTQFKYIIAEFHFGNKIEKNYLKVFTKLNLSHQIFHLHCNNAGSLLYIDDNIICSLIEISYIIKENNTFINNKDFFPNKNVDYKNINKKIDINLFLNMYHLDNLLNNF